MIVGHGDIASALVDRADRLYFAAGVSNSDEVRESEYRREIDLLMAQDRSAHLAYFSSLCVFYSRSRYAVHKRSMEALVRALFQRYTIVRLGNITWGTNGHTLINHLREQRRRGEPLIIRDVYRYLVDREELRHWLDLIPEWPAEMNVTGRRMKVQQIIEEFVDGHA